MKNFRNIFCVILLLVSSVYGYAQNDDLTKAYGCMDRGQVDSARTFIDKALREPAMLKEPNFWVVRGFVYKGLYKKYEINNIHSSYRDTAISDLFIAYRFNTENQEQVTGSLKYLAATYYNGAESLLDSVNFHKAVYAYNRYKSIMKQINPSQNFNAFDIGFYDILGNIYSSYFFGANSFNQKRRYLDSARKAFDAVLAINPDDYSAVFGIARIYYNQAVNIINSLPDTSSLDKVNKAQDSCIHLAKMSLPFMQKAHTLEPLKIEPIRGLQGDYVMLHDEENFKVSKQLEDKLSGQQNSNSPEAQYDNFIKQGDAAFKNEDYDAARTAYQNALKIKPDQKYPQDQLKAISAARNNKGK